MDRLQILNRPVLGLSLSALAVMLVYCKRCYKFRVTKFSRLAAQKHIRGLLNSR